MVADRWITDTDISRDFPVYTRANAGEVLPDPASPLGWSLVWEPGVVMGWYDSQIRTGTMAAEEFNLKLPEVVGLFGGYLYINGSLARMFGVRGPGLTPEMIDFVYFGEHPDVPPYVPEPWHENEERTNTITQWMGGVLMCTLLDGLRDDQKVANAARANRPDLSKLTDEQLVERARSFEATIRHMFDVHLEVTAGTSIGTGILNAVAAAAGDPTMALKLVTSVGDVDSAAPSHAMWALSRLDANSDEFKKGFKKFLEEFGSRAPNEWDIRSETWETRPELALALIDVMRKSGDDANPEKRNAVNAAQREAITSALRAGLADQPEVLGQFEAGLASAHAYLAARERAKTNIIKVIHEVRMAVRELASRHNYTMSQMCMLLNDELDAFVTDPDSFRARLTAREEQYLELFEYEPPFIVHKSVPPVSSWKKKGEEKFVVAKAGDTLNGVPGCPGVARGRARVVLDPSDPFALEPGDVLIAPITDPAWTPLFVPASAVVVNVGAQVSHAVIVSRELGIPCVVSVQGATESIPDGAMVEVNGDAGTVTLL